MNVLPSACRKSVTTALKFWNVLLKATCVLAELGEPTRSAATAIPAPSSALRHELRIAFSSPRPKGGALPRSPSSPTVGRVWEPPTEESTLPTLHSCNDRASPYTQRAGSLARHDAPDDY